MRLIARGEDGGVERGGTFSVRRRERELCLARLARSMAVSFVEVSLGLESFLRRVCRKTSSLARFSRISSSWLLRLMRSEIAFLAIGCWWMSTLSHCSRAQGW